MLEFSISKEENESILSNVIELTTASLTENDTCGAGTPKVLSFAGPILIKGVWYIILLLLAAVTVELPIWDTPIEGFRFKSKAKTDVKSDIMVDTIPALPPRNNYVYYHVTTYENALTIMNTGMLVGSSAEGGYVYAWRSKPNKYAIENSGAHKGALIRFSTSASFVSDIGIMDPKVKQYGPVISTRPGPIRVSDVMIVEVYK